MEGCRDETDRIDKEGRNIEPGKAKEREALLFYISTEKNTLNQEIYEIRSDSKNKHESTVFPGQMWQVLPQ